MTYAVSSGTLNSTIHTYSLNLRRSFEWCIFLQPICSSWCPINCIEVLKNHNLMLMNSALIYNGSLSCRTSFDVPLHGVVFGFQDSIQALVEDCNFPAVKKSKNIESFLTRCKLSWLVYWFSVVVSLECCIVWHTHWVLVCLVHCCVEWMEATFIYYAPPP